MRVVCAGRAIGVLLSAMVLAPLWAADMEGAAVGPEGDGAWIVPTQQRIDPAGRQVLFRGRPTDIAVRSDGAVVAVANRTDLLFLDPTTGEIRHTLSLPQGAYGVTGLCFSGDGGRIYSSTTEGDIAVASSPDEGAPAWVARIPLPADKGNPQPAGLALGCEPDQLLVCLGRRNTLGVVDTSTGSLIKEADVGIAPFDVVIVGRRAYVSNWGGDRPGPGDVTGPSSGSEVKVDARGIAREGTVTVVDLDTFSPVRSIRVGRHPCGMALHPNGRRLFVANANEDTVSVINTAIDRVTETINVRPHHLLPFGSAPNAVAVDLEGAWLAVANGGNNAVAMVRLGSRAGVPHGPTASEVAGFVPVGWYPAALAFSPDGRRLWVVNNKGIGSRAVFEGPEAQAFVQQTLGLQIQTDHAFYHSQMLMGSVSIIDLPIRGLPSLTDRVARNNREAFALAALARSRPSARPVPVPLYDGERSVFKHVLYIIKENRTYDQVFGDMSEGNGDPQLVNFGEKVTPNHHALAREFGLFDNFYCAGLISADGHQWTDAAYVTDYIEKSSGGWVRSYPWNGNDALAYASSGFLWDNALEHGLRLRIYGEFVDTSHSPLAVTWTDVYRDYLDNAQKIHVAVSANIPTIQPYICPTFPGWDTIIPDVYRAREFLTELRAAEEAGEWYDLMIMLLPNDHTVGTLPGFPTPRAMVADNDLALGQIVDAVTHSRFWSETIIFVVEDDPASGLDHVDGHRTVALVISPYNRPGIVDSHFYTQCSMVRTIELILGLPPMNQFDLGATPITTCFQAIPDLGPYTAVANRIPLDEMNPPLESLSGPARYWAEESLRQDLDHVDAADDDTMKQIIWYSAKGYDVPYPDRQGLALYGHGL